jgi:hypothetical protein
MTRGDGQQEPEPPPRGGRDYTDGPLGVQGTARRDSAVRQGSVTAAGATQAGSRRVATMVV